MTSRELASEVESLRTVEISGQTPWKTVNARLSEDIRSAGCHSKFMRTDVGQFGLREWEDVREFIGPKRKINPFDENIRVIDSPSLKAMKPSDAGRSVFQMNLRNLLSTSRSMRRREAEKRTDVVQLVPTFLVRQETRLLCYTRTKRLPETRLHESRSVSFGGHMQFDDIPELFFYDDDVLEAFLYRELLEELNIEPFPNIRFEGFLHLTETDFERQHIALVFDVELAPGSKVRSLEPGMHTKLDLESLSHLNETKSEYDSWSEAFIRFLSLRVLFE